MKTFKSKYSAMFFLPLLLFLFSCMQPDDGQWAKQGGGENYDAGRGITMDKDSNVIVVGRFQGNASFENNALQGKGDDEIFLLKYNSAGSLLWAKHAGGKKEDAGYAVTTDGSGNIFITGNFQDTVFFESQQLVSNGGDDAFIAKYDPDGNLLWVKKIGGTLNDFGRSIAIDKNDNCYLTGFFTGTISLDSFQISSDGFFEDIFLFKLNAQGKILWAKKAGGHDNDRAMGLAVDLHGNSYFTGAFNSTAVFDSIQLNSNGQSDFFIAKYDTDGKAVWAQKAGGAKIDEGHGIAVDEKGNSYATGFFVGEFLFDTPANEINVSSPQNLSSRGDRDIFIVKYNSEGKLQWARNAGGAGIDEGRAICSLPSGGCYVTGFFANNASFGDTLISNANDHDIFIAHYSSDGNLVSIKKTGSSGYDEGRSIIADGMGNVYLTGNYHGIPDFGNSKLPESRGDGDVFVLKVN